MSGEIIYTDLRRPGGGSLPAERRHRTPSTPAACPRWHGVLLKLSGLGLLVLLVLVVVLSILVFQKVLTPPSALQNKNEAGGRNRTEACVISSSLLRYYCNNSAGREGCKLCPQSWQLFGDQCYWVSKSSGTWTEGEKDCESKRSHLAVLRNQTDEEHLNETIHSLTVWIGLKKSNDTWKWVDNSSFNATPLGPLPSKKNVCMTFKGFNKLESDGCSGDHHWVCQKKPFNLLSKISGDGELCRARPEKP